MNKKIIFMLSIVLMGSSALTGCGYISADVEVKEEKTIQQNVEQGNLKQQNEEEQKGSDSIEADIQTMNDTKNYHFLSDGLMCTKEEDSEYYTFYQWEDNTYQSCDSQNFNQKVSIDGKKYLVTFSYVIANSQLYIANTYSGKADADIYVYPWGNRTDKVWMEVFEGREAQYYSLDLSTCKTENLLPEEWKDSKILNFELSNDGTYALAETDENQVFLIDLEDGTYENLNKKVNENTSAACFVKGHDIRYVAKNGDSEMTYKVWNVENGSSEAVIKDVGIDTVMPIMPEYLLYNQDSQTGVVSVNHSDMVSIPLEKKDFTQLFPNKNGTKAVFVTYTENGENEEVDLEKAYVVDFEKMTAAEITNIDTTCSYGVELNGAWTGENTFTFVTEAGLTGYSFGQ